MSVDSAKPTPVAVGLQRVADTYLDIMGLGRIVSEIHTQGRLVNKTTRYPAVVLNANELTSLRALIAYVAHQSGATGFSVARQVTELFGVTDITRLPSEHFDAALRYLVDCIEGE
jgi:hypothetical protein